jgi:arabinogalactan endo-1,4-beta-galactosidase
VKTTTLLILVLLASPSRAADAPFYLGGDISALSDLEKAGAIYRDNNNPGDAIAILHAHGCNLFRLRLFVNPRHDFDQNYGATQDLPMILALAKRIKHADAKLSLAIHYSDTWADPGNQSKPADWKALAFDALEKKVGEYTTDVLSKMKSNGTPPDIVEVGNETTSGMLWPDGKLGGSNPEEKQLHWDHFARLLKAGAAAVRSQLPSARILIHISGGGKAGLPSWYFSELKKQSIDFDIIGLSFYPTWNDSLDALKKNLTELSAMEKDILIIEAAYPYRPVKQTPQMQWPTTPLGQKQFLSDVISTVKSAPNHRGIGVVWWYPEAVPLKDHKIWEHGSLGLFDPTGNLLPALVERNN